jgi:hypothetical protein
MNHVAEIHLMKAEYQESRSCQISITSRVPPTSYPAVMANMNTAFIDILTGVDSKIILHHMETICYPHIQKLHRRHQTFLNLLSNQIFASLSLRDGHYTTANLLFAQTFLSSQDTEMQVAVECLTRLADLSTEMSNVKRTMEWAGVFLAVAMKSRNKLTIMKALYCLGQIFVAQKDDETALSLFTVALEGLAFLDVHYWRACCMDQIADIRECRGEILESVELWKAARPLFQRSSQAKDVVRIDRKLADVDWDILEEYEEILQQLAKLRIPVEELEEAHIAENKEPRSILGA